MNLPNGKTREPAKVLQRAVDENGDYIGHCNENPFLDTALYTVQFKSGAVKEFGANTIAMNLYDQVDKEGYQGMNTYEIVKHRESPNSVKSKDEDVYNTQGTRSYKRKTTEGWELLIRTQNSLTDIDDPKEVWMPLKVLKEAEPILTAEYAVANGLDRIPAFQWWVPEVLKRRNKIIIAAAKRIQNRRFKYGVEIPTSKKDAIRLDQENGNTFWQDALQLEMENVAVAFHFLEDNKPLPKGWTPSSGHIIWDVKMDLTRKARWVKDGHKTPDLTTSNFAGVVSQDSV